MRFFYYLLAVAAAKNAGGSDGDDINLTMFCPYWAGGGYGTECTTLSLALKDRLQLSLVHHGDSFNSNYVNNVIPPTLKSTLMDLSRGTGKVQDVVFCHSEPGAWNVINGPMYSTTRCPPSGFEGITIGRTMFETDRLPDGWAERLNSLDFIWVPTHWAFRIFKDAGVEEEKLRVIGEAVDSKYWTPPQTPIETEFRIEILSVFKWEARKAPEILLEAFCKAYTAIDHVRLTIVTSGYHNIREAEAMARTEILGVMENLGIEDFPQIKVLTGVSQQKLLELYQASTLFVLPSHGEGWGRPHVEAMACGTPVAATNWSGTTEFLNEENGYPIAVDRMIQVGEGAFRDHYWAQPSVDDLVRIFRHVSTNPSEAKQKGMKARELMVAEYTPDRIAEKFMGLLRKSVEATASRTNTSYQEL